MSFSTISSFRTSIWVCAMAFLLTFSTKLSANPAFTGRWQFDPSVSSALDGWHKMVITIQVNEPKITMTYDMLWRTSNVVSSHTFDTTQSSEIKNFFRIEQRHSAIYPAQNGITQANATWLDQGRTLRTEVYTPVEVSQGETIMRITSEYRLNENGNILTIIELHSSRNRPLIYVFRKILAEEKK